jgi:hypothetical protein
MPLPVLPGVVRATASGNIAGGGRWSNTWHFRRADLGDPDLALITLLHVPLAAFYVGQIMPNCPAATTIGNIDYTTLDGVSGAFSLPVSAVGSGGGDVLPAEVAEVLTIRTALRGRQNRGRLFFPAFTQGAFDGAGHIVAGTAGATVAAMVAMAAAAGLEGWQHGVGSYGPYVDPVTHALVPGTPHFTQASSYSMDLLADVIRSRKN